MRSIRKLVICGGNGALGASAGAAFAAAGVPTVLLARSQDKAEAGRARAEQLARGKLAPGALSCGTYASDLGHALADADLVIEAVSEDAAAKRALLALIDRLRGADTVVATTAERLVIASLCAERSASFRRNFVGIHLFRPPTAITGCELIAQPATDPGTIAAVRDFLVRCGREVVEVSDAPGFAGNRLAFKLLNEVAQLAEQHGVLAMDQLVGPHTGRTLAPLATIDLVGWDVHGAIVDHIHDATHDVAHDQFRLPDYMRHGIDRGLLGLPARDRGGFYRVEGSGPAARQLVLDPATGEHRPAAELARPLPPFIEAMKTAIRSRPDRGYRGAMEVLCTATEPAADLLRRIVLGYISYGLGLVGDVVDRPRDIDRVMCFGFHWAPPSVLVDAIGPGRTIVLLERARLPVPRPVIDAALHQRALFDEPRVDRARFFSAAA
jgi:3-hydroxybutyryl-CoA dehydrogenase